MRLIREFEARASVVTVQMSSFMAWAFFLAGKRDEALRVIDRALGGDPDPVHDWLLRFIRHALRNERDAAVATLGAEERAVAWGDADLPLVLPAFFAQLGRRGEALEWMARALERGLINYPFFARHEAFDSLRSDPRFQELSAAMKKAWKSSRIPGLV
ncbi:MAG: TPR end-of-group domain-containing protein [Longimicrobiales bacterium]